MECRIFGIRCSDLHNPIHRAGDVRFHNRSLIGIAGDRVDRSFYSHQGQITHAINIKGSRWIEKRLPLVSIDAFLCLKQSELIRG